MSTVAEIRYADVASFVGLALNHRSGHGSICLAEKAPSRHRAFVIPGVPSAPSNMTSKKSPNRQDELPPIVTAQIDKVRSQISMLQTEQGIQKEQCGRLERSLSDSKLAERRAKLRADKQRELHNHHHHRARQVEKQIGKLRQKLTGLRSGPVEDQNASAQSVPSAAEAVTIDDDVKPKEDEADRPPETDPTVSTAVACVASPGTRKISHATPGRKVKKKTPQNLLDVGNGPFSPSHATGSSATSSGKRCKTDITLDISAPEDELVALVSAGEDAGEACIGICNEALEYIEALGKPLNLYTKAEAAELNQRRRQVVRREMIARAGTARKAFAALDLNGSGSISSQEFSDGISRLGVKWNELTQLKTNREFFKLFDEDRDQIVIFGELFPEDAAAERAGQVRASTPDFWRRYRREKEQKMRPAEWQPAGPDDELKWLSSNRDMQHDAEVKRKWIEATFRRLKGKGKSDARCRELVALHLPHGTGPKDRQGVHTISEVDLRKIRQNYCDELNLPIRVATKTMSDMRLLRREQKKIIEKLYKVTEADQARARAEAAVASLGGFSLFGKTPAAAAPAEHAKDAAQGSAPRKPIAELAKAAEMTEMEVQDLSDQFDNVTGKNALSTSLWPRMLKALAPNRNLVETDLLAWWKQMAGAGGGKSVTFTEPKKTVATFDQFVVWYGTSELRSSPKHPHD